ncbi:unnamed protein product [Caenorhabditis brenneri]
MFKLLYLPYLAQREVLGFFDPIQIVEFSLLSRRARRIAQGPIISKDITVDISNFSPRRYIAVHFQSCEYYFRIFGCNNKKPRKCYLNGFVTGRRDDNARDEYGESIISFDSYWDEEQNGLTEMVKYISVLFNYPKARNVLLGFHNLPLTQWIIEKMAEKVENYQIRNSDGNVSHADMETHLNSCKSAYDRIYLTLNTSRDFQYNFDFNARQLTMNYSNWMTSNHIVQLSDQVESLVLSETYSTNQDLNKFLKYWLSIRTKIKMCKLVAFPENLKIDELFQGITTVPRENPESYIIITAPLGTKVRVDGQFDIYREDGAKATIFAAPVDHRAPFSMYIWPTERKTDKISVL